MTRLPGVDPDESGAREPDADSVAAEDWTPPHFAPVAGPSPIATTIGAPAQPAGGAAMLSSAELARTFDGVVLPS